MSEVIQKYGRTFAIWNNKKFSFFGGYDYHRLSSHPEVLKSLKNFAKDFGLSSGGSRLTIGNHPVHIQTEKKIAEYFDTESAVLMPNCYLANFSLLQVILEEYNIIFIDHKAHTSLIEPIQISGKKIIKFEHGNYEKLRNVCKKYLNKSKKPLIITEGYSNTYGALIPIDDYIKIADEFGGKLLVDDAHAVGVLGETGKGSCEEFGIPREKYFQTASLSKAFGVYGGFVVGSDDLIKKIKTRSKVYASTSAFPLPLCGAIMKSLGILKKEPLIISNYKKRSLEFKKKIKAMGFDIPISPTPIVPIIFETEEQNLLFRENLIKNKIFPSFSKFSGGPPFGFFRFVLSSEHNDKQIETLFRTIKKIKGEF